MTVISTDPPATTSWSSLHAFLDGGQKMEDAFLLDAVVPAIRAAGSPPWFFVRYWEGGPHVRVRVRGTSGQSAAVEAACANWVADAGAGRVERIAYRPEVQRYGGLAGLAVSESFFHESSEVAAAVVAKARTPEQRTGAALDLLVAFALAVAPDGTDAVRLLRSYAAGLAYVAEGPPVDVPRLAQAAEAELIARREALGERFEQLVSRLTGDVVPRSLVDHWFVRTRATAVAYRELFAEGRLAGEPDRILTSQLHMFHNRLGVLLPEEAYLASLVGLLFAHANPLDDYRADGPDATDRRYHEASKMYAARFWDIPSPAAGARTPRWAPAWLGREVPLPDADDEPLASTSLADVLAARRSCYGTYGAGLSIAELSTLLRRAAGPTVVTRYPGDGARVGLRSYPSAGARYAVGLAVVARDVDGLDPAVYAYDADAHSLRHVRPAPSLDELVRCSPMLGTGTDRGTIDVTDAPAVLALVGELTYQREKYGIRAYRLLLLEAGHLAQNVALVATALGLATVPLGSFYDDAASRLVMADAVNATTLYLMPLARSGPGVVTAAGAS